MMMTPATAESLGTSAAYAGLRTRLKLDRTGSTEAVIWLRPGHRSRAPGGLAVGGLSASQLVSLASHPASGEPKRSLLHEGRCTLSVGVNDRSSSNPSSPEGRSRRLLCSREEDHHSISSLIPAPPTRGRHQRSPPGALGTIRSSVLWRPVRFASPEGHERRAQVRAECGWQQCCRR